MKFSAVIDYVDDSAKLKLLYAEHRTYLRQFLESGQLFAAGLHTDNQGAVWILDAESLEDVNAIVRGDPFNAAGLFAKWEVRTLVIWSAKEYKGK